MLVHADLPFLSHEELTEVIRITKSHDVLLCPDRHGQGTNVMGINRALAFPLSFGQGSYERHRRTLIDYNLSWCRLKSEGLANDIDCPKDLVGIDSFSADLGIATSNWCKLYRG